MHVINPVRLNSLLTLLKYMAGNQQSVNNEKDDGIGSALFLPDNTSRKAEGGLRFHEKFMRNETDQPLVSVITIVFNGGRYLEQTIKSVINQTYNNVEYIVIDGGSTDGTLNIIRKYSDQIDYWVSEPDDGITDAFNKGISLCSGVIIGIINSDDWYELDAIEKIVDFKNLSSVFCGNVKYWDGYKEDYIFTTNITGLPKEMTVNHPAVFVSKCIYEKYGVFDSKYKYAMDYELLLRFYINGVHFIEIDSVLSNMRLAGLSDKRRTRSYNDVRLAKMQYGESYLAALGYNIWQLTRKKVSSFLSLIGLESIVMNYRRKHSVIKKQKINDV